MPTWILMRHDDPRAATADPGVFGDGFTKRWTTEDGDPDAALAALFADNYPAEDVIKAAARVLVGAVLDLLQEDNHNWSERGCGTCRAISSIVGRPFGCYEFARRKAAGEPLHQYKP